MIYTLTRNQVFAASHVLEGHPRCGKMHGHTYRVDVTVIGDPEPETFNMVADDQLLQSYMAAAVRELDGRHLNDMLPATIPSVNGIAAWFWENLALHFKMQEVTVWQDDLAASVRRDRLGLV